MYMINIEPKTVQCLIMTNLYGLNLVSMLGPTVITVEFAT